MTNINSSNSQFENKSTDKDFCIKEENQNYYGRTYHESVPFTQANFEALQNILNKRNELLGTVKSHPLI